MLRQGQLSDASLKCARIDQEGPVDLPEEARYTFKRNTCGLILTCDGAPSRTLTWNFRVGMR